MLGIIKEILPIDLRKLLCLCKTAFRVLCTNFEPVL